MPDTKLSAIKRTGDETDKQFIVNLFQGKTINRLQMLALARRYEDLKAEGEEKPLAAVLREFDAGKLVMDREAAAREAPPKLADAPAHESDKSKLLWLHEKGTLTMDQVRAAAALLASEPERDLKGVLREIGATAALDAEEPEQDGPAIPFSEDQMKAARHVLEHTVPEIKEILSGVTEQDDLDCLHATESAEERPRKGVLDAIEERIGELVEGAGKSEGEGE